MIEIESDDVDTTMRVGRRLAALLRPDDVILVCGRLGAGKTAFVGGLADGLGVEEPVTSPSFVLMRRYDSGFIPLVHVDVYRLGSLAEFEDLDVFEQAAGAVLVVEWGDAVAGALPDEHLTVRIDVGDGGRRSLRLEPAGGWNDRPLQELSA